MLDSLPTPQPEFITPELAKEYLKHNKVNRPKRPDYIEGIARDIKRGQYHPTHQGIAFDENGDLIDGQNRLYAIIEADTPISILVSRNVKHSSGAYIDCGAARTFRDSLAFDGRYSDDPALRSSATAATVRALFRNEMGELRKLTNSEVLSVIGTMAEYLKGIYSATIGRTTVPAEVRAAALAALLCGESPADIFSFFSVFCSGNAKADGKNIAVVWNWKQQIQNAKLQRRPISRDTLYRNSQNAIWHFCRGTGVQILKATSTNRYDVKDKLKTILDTVLGSNPSCAS